MESKGLFVLLLAALISLASPECLDGDCNSTDVVQPIKGLPLSLVASLFFPPVDIYNERNHFANDAIDPRLPIKNEEETVEDSSSSDSSDDEPLEVFETIIIRRNDQISMDQQSEGNLLFMQFRNSLQEMEDFETLDLSGQTLTGETLERRLKMRILLGQPVSSLILSNARIEGLTQQHLQPVQDTLRKLSIDNCISNLDLLANFSNLQFLNLSNNGLSIFQWFPMLTDTLEELDLSRNDFVEVRPELSVLTSLRKLDLSYNKIQSVQEFPLSLLPSLENLSLTMNSIKNATFTELFTLQQLNLDWNYLRSVGYELQLPAHSISLKLASNPWRCDCGILQARDENEILDLDRLMCANELQYAVCDGCRRYFLPIDDGRLVRNETKDSIEYLGCTSISDQLHSLHGALIKLREREPEKLFAMGMIFLGSSIMMLLGIMSCRASYLKKKFDRKSWLKQQIPYLKIDKLSKPQEVPYVKI